MYWSLIHGEKEQPASSHLRMVGKPVQATQPSHPSRLVWGNLQTRLEQEEMGNSATVESNSSSHHTRCSAGEGLPASALFVFCFLGCATQFVTC